MEATICTSTPDVPTVPERQPVKLPDEGSPATTDDFRKRRRAIIAGLMTSPEGIGSPGTAKPTLG